MNHELEPIMKMLSEITYAENRLKAIDARITELQNKASANLPPRTFNSPDRCMTYEDGVLAACAAISMTKSR